MFLLLPILRGFVMKQFDMVQYHILPEYIRKNEYIMRHIGQVGLCPSHSGEYSPFAIGLLPYGGSTTLTTQGVSQLDVGQNGYHSISLIAILASHTTTSTPNSRCC